MFKWYSFNSSGDILHGTFDSKSFPSALFGKAITSRIELVLHIIDIRRSSPKIKRLNEMY